MIFCRICRGFVLGCFHQSLVVGLACFSGLPLCGWTLLWLESDTMLLVNALCWQVKAHWLRALSYSFSYFFVKEIWLQMKQRIKLCMMVIGGNIFVCLDRLWTILFREFVC